MNIPTAETPELMLRAWRPADAERWYELLLEPGILQYFPDQDPPERGRADWYIEHHAQEWSEHGYGHWAVVTRADGRVVGWCGLEYLPELDQAEVAYLLSRSVWGRGYATAAARLALRFGFEQCGLPEIIGLVHPDNAGSIRVLEKCGMALQDRLTLWGLEMLRYRIGRAEWRALTPEPAAASAVG